MEYKSTIINKSNINDAIMMENGNIVTVCDDKLVTVFDKTNKLISHILLSKKPTCVVELDETILVSDKFGDVYQFKMSDLVPAEEDANKNKDTIANNIILAHFSVINEISVSKRKNAIISCDRDEKIRVTRYPRTDIIQSFCYGFVELITSCKSEIVENKQIIAAGGCDGSLRIFDIADGKELAHHQFGSRDVVVIYDMKMNGNVLEMIVSIEGKYSMIVKNVVGENCTFGSFEIERIENVIKGGKFVGNDILVYLTNDSVQFVKEQKLIELKKEGANEELKNDGIVFESMRKNISPKERFLNCDGDDEVKKLEK